MNRYADILESYLIPAQEGLFGNLFGIFGVTQKKYSKVAQNEKIKLILISLKNINLNMQKSIPDNYKYSIPDGKIAKLEKINGYDVILYTSENDKSFKSIENFGVLVKNKNEYKIEKFSLELSSVKSKIMKMPEYKKAMINQMAAQNNIQHQQQLMQQHQIQQSLMMHQNAMNQAQLAHQNAMQMHTMGVNSHAIATFGHPIM